MLVWGLLQASSATWDFGTDSALALGPRKITENLDRVGLSQDLPDAYRLPASSPAFKHESLTVVPICAVALFNTVYSLIYRGLLVMQSESRKSSPRFVPYFLKIILIVSSHLRLYLSSSLFP
jgi:hypothetical protein